MTGLFSAINLAVKKDLNPEQGKKAFLLVFLSLFQTSQSLAHRKIQEQGATIRDPKKGMEDARRSASWTKTEFLHGDVELSHAFWRDNTVWFRQISYAHVREGSKRVQYDRVLPQSY